MQVSGIDLTNAAVLHAGPTLLLSVLSVQVSVLSVPLCCRIICQIIARVVVVVVVVVV